MSALLHSLGEEVTGIPEDGSLLIDIRREIIDDLEDVENIFRNKL